MRVSVVIPTYNYARYLSQAIESVLAQTYPVSEILVVDDGSTDNTREVASGFGGRVRYIYQQNAGPAAARNRGIREAAGDWIAILDADDWWAPEKIELQAREVTRDPDVGLVYTGVTEELPDGTRKAFAPTPADRIWPRLRYLNCVSGGSGAFIRRDILLAENGFDESVHGVEDWDCWVRLARKYRFAAVMAPVTMIRVWPDSLSYNHEKLIGETRKILDKTLVGDLHGWKRTVWKRRIWCNQLFHCAISVRKTDRRRERALLLQSLREWPSPFFAIRRWKALFWNVVRG